MKTKYIVLAFLILLISCNDSLNSSEQVTQKIIRECLPEDCSKINHVLIIPQMICFGCLLDINELINDQTIILTDNKEFFEKEQSKFQEQLIWCERVARMPIDSNRPLVLDIEHLDLQ